MQYIYTQLSPYKPVSGRELITPILVHKPHPNLNVRAIGWKSEINKGRQSLKNTVRLKGIMFESGISEWAKKCLLTQTRRSLPEKYTLKRICDDVF